MNTATTDGLLDELRRVKAERDAWAAQYQKAQQEAAVAMGQRDQAQAGLATRFEATPAMREVIGELRTIQDCLHNGAERIARSRLGDLLRRIDLESQA